jgi:hypothetical protein
LRPRLTTGLPFSLAHTQGCALCASTFPILAMNAPYTDSQPHATSPRGGSLFVHMEEALCWIWGRSVRVQTGAMRTSENAHSLKLLAGSGVVAPPLYCCVSYVRTERARSCVHKKHNTRRYGRPLAGSLVPIGVRLCTLSRQRELRLNGVLRS